MIFTKAQIKAINQLTGNLQLIACAGSGKTEVVAHRLGGEMGRTLLAFSQVMEADRQEELGDESPEFKALE